MITIPIGFGFFDGVWDCVCVCYWQPQKHSVVFLWSHPTRARSLSVSFLWLNSNCQIHMILCLWQTGGWVVCASVCVLPRDRDSSLGHLSERYMRLSNKPNNNANRRQADKKQKKKRKNWRRQKKRANKYAQKRGVGEHTKKKKGDSRRLVATSKTVERKYFAEWVTQMPTRDLTLRRDDVKSRALFTLLSSWGSASCLLFFFHRRIRHFAIYEEKSAVCKWLPLLCHHCGNHHNHHHSSRLLPSSIFRKDNNAKWQSIYSVRITHIEHCNIYRWGWNMRACVSAVGVWANQSGYIFGEGQNGNR